MRRYLLILIFPIIVITVGCESMSSAPTLIEDEASGIAVTFPGFPVNHTTSENPHRRMVEVLNDSISVWLSVMELQTDFNEDVRTGAVNEADKMLKEQKFEPVTRVDSTFLDLPSSLLWYQRNDEQMYHLMVFKDSFIIDLSALITDTSQYYHIDKFFNSLRVVEP